MYALIFAGGMGGWLRPLTGTLPKPMAPLCEKPILWHRVQWLRQAGVTGIVFLVGYRWQTIQDYLDDGGAFGFRAQQGVIPLRQRLDEGMRAGASSFNNVGSLPATRNSRSVGPERRAEICIRNGVTYDPNQDVK